MGCVRGECGGKRGDGGKWVKKGRRKWERGKKRIGVGRVFCGANGDRGKRCKKYKMSRERAEVQRVSFEEE